MCVALFFITWRAAARRCALGGPTGLVKRSGPGGPLSGPQSGPLNEPTSGGGSGVSVTGGVTDQPTFRREK